MVVDLARYGESSAACCVCVDAVRSHVGVCLRTRCPNGLDPPLKTQIAARALDRALPVWKCRGISGLCRCAVTPRFKLWCPNCGSEVCTAALRCMAWQIVFPVDTVCRPHIRRSSARAAGRALFVRLRQETIHQPACTQQTTAPTNTTWLAPSPGGFGNACALRSLHGPGWVVPLLCRQGGPFRHACRYYLQRKPVRHKRGP